MTYVILNKSHLRADLREHIAEVIFDKVDGTRRLMRCTLKPSMLPEGVTSSTLDEEIGPGEDPHPNTLAVWDVDKNGWRSFRTDRVLSCQILQGWG